MKQITQILLLAFLFCANTATATHGTGADIKFTSLGGNTYQFELTFFRDCAGILPTLPALNVVGCNQAAGTIQMTQVGQPLDIAGICPGFSTCSTPPGTLPGVQQYTYRGVYTFPSQCSDWTISFSQCCRNNAINNLVSPGNSSFYTDVHLNNLDISNDNSPDFTSLPVSYMCAGQLYNYSFGTIDPDGDEIEYTLSQPLSNATTLIAYNPPFTLQQPMCAQPANSASFSTTTGLFSIRPCANQQVVLAVVASEYRYVNGVRTFIGSVRRDIQLIAVNCGTNVTPEIAAPANVVPANAFTAQGYSGDFRVCSGSSLSFKMTVNDANLTDTIDAVIQNLPQGATVTSTGTNPKTLTFNWTPSANQAGTYLINLHAIDSYCPTQGISDRSYRIIVGGVKLQANKFAFCAGTPTVVTLTTPNTTTSNGVYTWQTIPATTVSTVNANTFTATISQATSFGLTYTSGGCSATDTVYVRAYGKVNATPALVTFTPGTSISPIQLTASYPNPAPSAPNLSGINTGNTCVGAASNIAVGAGSLSTGTTNGIGSPFQGFWHDGRFQMLFTKAELQAAGVQRGLISEVAMNVITKGSTIPYNSFSIKIGSTNLVTLNSAAGFVANTSTVYTNPAFSTVVGANIFALQNPYFWNGVDNLVIEMCYDNNTFTQYDHVNYGATANNSVLYQRTDGSTGCNLAVPSTSTNRPNIVFRNCTSAPQVTTGVAYTWVAQGGSLNNTTIANPLATPSSTFGNIDRFIVTANDGTCTSSDTVIVLNTSGPCQALASITKSSDLTCSTTSVNLDARSSAGSSPLTYLWNTGETTPQTAVTAAGVYTVTVSTTGTANCTRSATIAVVSNTTRPLVSFTPTASSLTCNRTSVTINTTPAVGNFSYNYGAGFVAAPQLTVTQGGTYTVVVQNNANGCTGSATRTITQNITQPSFTLANTNRVITCTTPTVNISVCNPAVTNYSYVWYNGATTCTSAPITQVGTYTVRTTDNANGCSRIDSVSVTSNLTAPIATISAVNSLTNCSDAVLTARSNLLTTSYLWNTGSSLDTTHVQQAGTYTVTATNIQTGCTSTSSFVYTAQSFTGSATETVISVCNAATGVVSATWSSPFAPYQISIDGGFTITTANNSFNFTNIAAGAHNITVISNNGCVLNLPITTTCVTGVNDIAENYSLHIAPNPASQHVNITANLQNINSATLVLRNLLGQVISSQTIQNNAITSVVIGDLPRGVYSAEIWNNNSLLVSQKLVKM